MFTGIIQGLGTVRTMTRKGQDGVIGVRTLLPLHDLKKGDSVAVNGVCLTITEISGQDFSADVSAETLARSNLRFLKAGERVNLEKALRPVDFLGGHIVLGHVDGSGRIAEKTPKSGSVVLAVTVEEGLGRYIVEKGSIAVDGISLTINRFAGSRFYVNIIPHTRRSRRWGIPSTSKRTSWGNMSRSSSNPARGSTRIFSGGMDSNKRLMA